MAFIVPRRADGPKTHLPIAIVIDRSASTNDIRELMNQCAHQLIRSMKAELTFRGVVELLVVLYSSDYDVVVDFKPLEKVSEYELDIQDSKGFTETGRALLYTLDRLDKRKMMWKQKGERYYQPLLFLLTDGYPDAGLYAPKAVEDAIDRTYAAAATEIREKEKENKLIFIAAGIQQKNGHQANIDKLKELTIFPERVLQLSDVAGSVNNIEKFYHLIHESTNAMFTGTPIDEVVGQIWNAV